MDALSANADVLESIREVPDNELCRFDHVLLLTDGYSNLFQLLMK